jgi:hypothetical protein
MRHRATVFEQIVQRFSWHRFDRHVSQHGADENQRGFSSRKQFLAMLAGSFGGHQGLRPRRLRIAGPNGRTARRERRHGADGRQGCCCARE